MVKIGDIDNIVGGIFERRQYSVVEHVEKTSSGGPIFKTLEQARIFSEIVKLREDIRQLKMEMKE